MCFNSLHQILITADGHIKWSFHLVNMIKLTPVSWAMTPVVINFSIKGGQCDSHANRAQWQRGHDTLEEKQRVITLSVCRESEHCSLEENNCLSLHYQHICRSGRFYCVYAFTYCNELLIIHSKSVKWAIGACGHFHQGTQSLFLFYGSCCLPFSFTYYTQQVLYYLKI